MKILMLAADFLPNIGGIAAHVYELSKALVKRGNDVCVVTRYHQPGERNYEEIDGIKIFRAHLPRIKLIGTATYSFLVYLRIRWLIKKEGLDILHIHALNPDAPAARFTGNIPKVETEHSSGFLMAMDSGKSLALYRWLLNSADYVIGPSQELVDAFIKLGVKPDKTSFISNGVDVEKFHPGVKGREIREKYRIKTEESVILCPRRLDAKNGVWYFIEAIPHILKGSPNTKCLIVGDGIEGERLKQRVLELGITDRVIFTGRVANSEMPGYYAASDIVVLPSLIEATSIAGLEAMATGKPLVGTSVGGIPQIVDDGKTGILVPPRNSEKLAQGIISLLKDNEKRRAMGLNARKRAEEEFSWDKIAGKVLSVYNKAIESKKESRVKK